jgi:hypothetical protein
LASILAGYTDDCGSPSITVEPKWEADPSGDPGALTDLPPEVIWDPATQALSFGKCDGAAHEAREPSAAACAGVPTEKTISIKFVATSGSVTDDTKGFTLTILNVCETSARLVQGPGTNIADLLYTITPEATEATVGPVVPQVLIDKPAAAGRGLCPWACALYVEAFGVAVPYPEANLSGWGQFDAATGTLTVSTADLDHAVDPSGPGIGPLTIQCALELAAPAAPNADQTFSTAAFDVTMRDGCLDRSVTPASGAGPYTFRTYTGVSIAQFTAPADVAAVSPQCGALTTTIEFVATPATIEPTLEWDDATNQVTADPAGETGLGTYDFRLKTCY